MPPESYKRTRRRGIAIISFVVALLVVGSFALWLFQLTAATASSSLGHYYSTGAFYAAEGGLEMAMREINQQNDFDGDSSVSGVPFGTISDNGNAADDPALASGAAFVQQVSTSPPLYRATGRPIQATTPWSTFTRVVEARVE